MKKYKIQNRSQQKSQSCVPLKVALAGAVKTAAEWVFKIS